MVQAHRPDGHLPPFELHLLLRSRPQRVPARAGHVVRRGRTAGHYDADPRSAVEIPQAGLFRRTADRAHHPPGNALDTHQFLLRNLQRAGRPAQYGYDPAGLHPQRFAASVPLSGMVPGADPQQTGVRFCARRFVPLDTPARQCSSKFDIAIAYSYLCGSICDNL